MSNYNSLKTTINANVKQNGVQAITGQILNSVLNAMVNTLGAGYQFAGVATPASNPGSPDARVFYIANGKGTYTNFGGISVTEDDVVVLYWDSSWHKESTGIASQGGLILINEILGYDMVQSFTSAYQTLQLKTPIPAGSTIKNIGTQGVYLNGSTFFAIGKEVVTTTNITSLKSSASGNAAIRVYGLIESVDKNKTDIVALENRKVDAYSFLGTLPPVNMLYLNTSVDGYLDGQGNIVPSTTYRTSDFIPVDGSEKYTFGRIRGAYQYDENKNIIPSSLIDSQSAVSYTATTLSNAHFIRVYYGNGYSNVAQVSKGETLPEYIGYATDVPFIRIPFKNVTDVAVPLDNIQGVIKSNNLLNKSNVVSGYLNSSGNIQSNSAYVTSDYIPVEAISKYSFAYVRFVAEYTSTKFFVTGSYADKSSVASSSIVTKSNASFIRVTIEKTPNLYRAIVNKGDLVPYDAFGYRLPDLITKKSKFDGLKMVCFGDSITGSVDEISNNNWCMYLSDATGVKTINQGYWSGRVAYADDAADVVNAFAFYKLVDSIISGDWSDQDIIYSTPGYEGHAAQLDKLKQINFSEVDFLSISLGTNDFASGTPFEIEGQPKSTESVNGAFRYSIEKLLTNFPQLRILITTPIYRFIPSTGEDYVVGGQTLQSFVDDYIELGKEMRIPVINLYNDIGVNKTNRVYYWGANGGDGLHPIATMKKVMGEKIAGGLVSIY